MQFIGRPEGSLAALADLTTVIEIRQGIRAKGAICEHSPRYQELRPVNVSGVPRWFTFKRDNYVTDDDVTRTLWIKIFTFTLCRIYNFQWLHMYCDFERSLALSRHNCYFVRFSFRFRRDDKLTAIAKCECTHLPWYTFPDALAYFSSRPPSTVATKSARSARNMIIMTGSC